MTYLFNQLLKSAKVLPTEWTLKQATWVPLCLMISPYLHAGNVDVVSTTEP